MAAPIWLITGAQASGKSTVGELLAARFERSVHVRGGQFYRWAVRGWVHFDDSERPVQARELLDLRYRLSATVAAEYATAGFVTVVQDNIYGTDVVRWMAQVANYPRHLVVLRPRVDVVQLREDQRHAATGKVAYRDGYTPAHNDAHLLETPRELGLWLDTSGQTPDESVAEILRRRAEAAVA